MEIGVGLPNAVRGVTGEILVSWGRRAEELGFTSLATIDRIAYPSFDSLTTLAVAAAVTQRIRLMTAILVGPLRTNTALLAKQAATIDRFSGGRLVLGLAVGERAEDFAASGVARSERGARLEAQLAELRRIWSPEGAGIGPEPARTGGPPLIIGGHAPGALARAARWGDGWMGGGAGPHLFRSAAASVISSWRRDGRPRLLAQAYFAVGQYAPDAVATFLRDYYGFAGPYRNLVTHGVASSEAEVRALVKGYSAVGCDELVLMPCSPGFDQLEGLASVVRSSPTATLVS